MDTPLRAALIWLHEEKIFPALRAMRMDIMTELKDIKAAADKLGDDISNATKVFTGLVSKMNSTDDESEKAAILAELTKHSENMEKAFVAPEDKPAADPAPISDVSAQGAADPLAGPIASNV